MVKNGSLYKSNAVFEKEEFSHSDNDILQLKPFIMYLKSHKVIFVILSKNTGLWQLPIVGLWQLPIVSSAFNMHTQLVCTIHTHSLMTVDTIGNYSKWLLAQNLSWWRVIGRGWWYNTLWETAPSEVP